ncbi:MAG: UvrB/UvrC motif-containing protein [Patescibacteria group bacterium]
MYWANFLHLYQPPTQKPHWIKRVTAESYRKIFTELKNAPDANMTVNINAVLVEHWDACGEDDVIEDVRTLLERGQLELTGSAKYHPLLPFLPKDEVVRQIELNNETHRKYFGSSYQPRGFFPPEMAFSLDLARTVQEFGFEWIIVDELSFPRGKELKYDHIYTIKGVNNFNIYFRERRMSWVILSGQIGTGNLLIDSLGQRLTRNEYLLTAMDGETFGHHRPGLEQLLFEIYRSPKLHTILISDLPHYFPQREAVTPQSSTWALMEKDLERKVPFARWKDADNPIHDMQWELTNLAIETVRGAHRNDPGYPAVRDALDRALHSDQYWWASAKPWWSIEMIERGAKELYDAISKTPGINETVKEEAKHLYHTIVFTAFDWQRSGLVDELSHKEDEDIRQRTDAQIPQLPKKEIEKMVRKLENEMNTVAARQEFERAAQIRDRIAELKRYAADVATPKPSAEGDKEWEL